ncbi:MAG: protein kinase [Myxococcales bacterium]|nr:protein kinase [Myxococcales bacterium]
MSKTQSLAAFGASTEASADARARQRTARYHADDAESEGTEIELPANGLIDGRYRVIDRIGDGGMGIVLRAHDERLRREVALKIIRPHLLDESELVQQFLAEARAMAQLRHPNVVEVHDFGQYGRLPYFAMRFVDGPDLHSWVCEQSLPLPVDVALGIIGQICEGVAAIHDAGVVHRDIKPENMLVDHGFRVVVTDFGLVRPVDQPAEHVEFQITGGTAGYMAPELAGEHRVDPYLAPRADVYALGIIAYWLLVGRHPFTARTRAQMLEQQINAPVPIPSDARPDLPPALDPVILGALHKDPRERTPDARALADQLRAARHRMARRHLRVVVVDEDESSLTWMRDVLGETLPNAEVIGVADSNQALDVIEATTPALVVTALENDSVSGLELAATLRGNPATRAMPVLVVSAVGGASEWRALWRIGVQGLLLKPLVWETFVPQVQGLLPRNDGWPATPGARPRR